MPSKRQSLSVFVLFVTLCVFLWHIHPTLYTPFAQQPTDMSITHIVLFQFKASADAAVISDVTTRMLALKDNCLHPSSQQPYIKSSSGGLDNSIEGIQHGITHAFVVEFASKEDRDYYVRSDPVHQEFIHSLDGIIEKAQVIDFADRVF